MRGARVGASTVWLLAKPSTATEAAKSLAACVDATAPVVLQGANTGLTGGSLPFEGEDVEPAVLLNTRRLGRTALVDGGKRVLCEAGVGITTLAQEMRTVGRESHSVLGSVFLNPTVAAGVAFGSGGTQVRKGPSYTERALYCKVDADSRVLLVNELGIDGLPEGEFPLDQPEGVALLEAYEAAVGKKSAGLSTATDCTRRASDTAYGRRMALMDGDISRFNADTRGPHVNRCEGKVLILATVHDTYALPKRKRSLWVSTDSTERAFELKRALFAAERERQSEGGGAGGEEPASGEEGAVLLPASIEYMNGDCVAAIDEAGRWLMAIIGLLGVESELLKYGFALKSAIERVPLLERVPDILLCTFNGLLPAQLPPAVQAQVAACDNHMLIDLCDYGHQEDAELFRRLEAFAASADASSSAASSPPVLIYEAADAAEAKRLSLFRFVAAAVFKVYCTGKGFTGMSLDYVLPTDVSTVPDLPVEAPKRPRYSHFGCNVVHDDIALPGATTTEEYYAIKKQVKANVEALRGRLPSEHGHGTEYEAPEDTKQRWMEMDPTNALNPGVGGLSPHPHYRR